jgi:phosphoribosylanthranilate isomerase
MSPQRRSTAPARRGGNDRGLDAGSGFQPRAPDAPLARTFVKICGLTTEDAVSAAVEAGADAAGFVFAESPRRVSFERASALAALLPWQLLKVAVFRRATRDEIALACERFAPDVVQADAACLHGVDLLCGVRALPVLRDGESIDDGEVGWLLYESRESGAGKTADWSAAAELARKRQVILAGGLDARNVGEALRRVRPWGVDVSSGVEEARGVKSPRRIREFIEAVRAAERAQEEA